MGIRSGTRPRCFVSPLQGLVRRLTEHQGLSAPGYMPPRLRG
jgi:hypothetical protein